MLLTAVWLLLILLLVRQLWRGEKRDRLPAGWADETEREMARLRGEVERLTREVGRLHDEQSFMVRLLEDRDRPGLRSGSPPAQLSADEGEDDERHPDAHGE